MSAQGELAIIGGSGFVAIVDTELVETLAMVNRFGQPSAPLEHYRCGNERFYFLARHGRPHRIAPHRINYRANIWALHECGVRHIIAINAVGGIAAQARAGAILIPDQIIDYTYGREQTFYDGETICDSEAMPLRHIDFTAPYSPTLRAQLLQVAMSAKVDVLDGGVYAATQGPRLESAAEIARLERDGCAVVGMTAMPEAALARELDIEYASLCVVVNLAAGKSTEPLTLELMQRAMATGKADVDKIVQAWLMR